MSQTWMVRAGRNDEYASINFAKGILVVGWDRVADLTKHRSRAEVAQLVRSSYPEVSDRTVDAYAVQLWAFRSLMQVDDLVVLLRSNSPDIAIGKVSGQYSYSSDGRVRHMRPVKWMQRDLRRGEVGPDLLDPPAHSAVYRLAKGPVENRLWALAGQLPPPVARGLELPDADETTASAAYDGLRRNLNYARNLTAAGSHLEQLKVSLFEVSDVYRAAWVQAVAALDHWVHQEIIDRMLRLSEKPGGTKPDGYLRFNLPLSLVEKVRDGHVTLRDALDQGLRASLGGKTYQSPDKIQEGLAHVANVRHLWSRVAKAVNEKDEPVGSMSAADVQSRLREVVYRRNKIAHEYDEVGTNPPTKRHIDVATTMQTIDWLDKLAEALLAVLDQE